VNIKIIGLGGTGSHLYHYLLQYFQYYDGAIKPHLFLIDKDKVELRNLERQKFDRDNIGQSKVFPLASLADDTGIDVTPNETYVNEDNVVDIVQDGDVIFLAVDNHYTRKIVLEKAEQLDNVVVVNSGNEESYGNISVFVREGGLNKTESLLDQIPDIKDATYADHPEASCAVRVESEPQLMATNALAGLLMFITFSNIVFEEDIKPWWLKSNRMYFNTRLPGVFTNGKEES